MLNKKCEYVMIITECGFRRRKQCNHQANHYGADGKFYCGTHANKIATVKIEKQPKEKKKYFKIRELTIKCSGTAKRNKGYDDCQKNGKYTIDGIDGIFCYHHAMQYSENKKEKITKVN